MPYISRETPASPPARPAGAVSIHCTTFMRQPATGTYWGRCTCGWSATGKRAEVQGLAAVHDLDDEVMA